jgi:AcrR family transcriptional regulator
MSRIEIQRRTVMQRLATAARVPLAESGGVTPQLIDDVCRQAGVHPHSFRALFPDDDAFLDAVNDGLVEDCAARLRGGVEAFVPTQPGGPGSFDEAAKALADSWPLDRAGMLIRADRRVRALRRSDGGPTVLKAEKLFLDALVDVLSALIAKLGRRFSWSAVRSVRVILDTYERSFETWLLTGNDEADFHSSPYVRHTLPALLEAMSEPGAPDARADAARSPAAPASAPGPAVDPS